MIPLFSGCKAAALGICLSLMAVVAPAQASDAPGCKDDPALKRFAGASIILCRKKDFEAIKAPAGPMKEYDFDKKAPVWTSALDVEGALSQNVYQIKKGPSALEVYRNYLGELEAGGFEILFKAEQADIGHSSEVYFGEEKFGPGGQLIGYAPENARYVSARLKSDKRAGLTNLHIEISGFSA